MSWASLVSNTPIVKAQGSSIARTAISCKQHRQTCMTSCQLKTSSTQLSCRWLQGPVVVCYTLLEQSYDLRRVSWRGKTCCASKKISAQNLPQATTQKSMRCGTRGKNGPTCQSRTTFSCPGLCEEPACPDSLGVNILVFWMKTSTGDVSPCFLKVNPVHWFRCCFSCLASDPKYKQLPHAAC